MSELEDRWFWAYPTESVDCDGISGSAHEVYSKSEADAVIAELKRALWLARAKRAEARKNYWYVRSIHEGDKNLWSIDGSAVKYIGCIKRTNFEWLKIWSEVECKCRAKAEQYE